MLRSISSLFIVGASLLCLGCGGGGDQVAVEGVITLDGQPLASIQVLFDQPELGPNENKGYTGKTDERGRYVLSPAFGEGTGVRPGKYRVSLSTAYDASAPPPTSASRTSVFFPESAPPPPERIPPAYRNGKLTFEVPSGGTTSADFKLVSK